MRKITKLLFVLSIMMLVTAPISFAKDKPVDQSSKKPKHKEKTLTEEEIKHLENRLIEIKEMDKSVLSKAEKRKLRREVKGIEKTLATGPFIYISASALIIILLLILLL